MMIHPPRTPLGTCLSMPANFPTGHRHSSRSPPRQHHHHHHRAQPYRQSDSYEDGAYYNMDRVARAYPEPEYSADMYDADYRGQTSEGAGDGRSYGDERYRRPSTDGGRYGYDSRPPSHSGSDGRQRSGSPASRQYRPGTPTDTVILEGLPTGVTPGEVRFLATTPRLSGLSRVNVKSISGPRSSCQPQRCTGLSRH
jgi:hypothetical protein